MGEKGAVERTVRWKLLLILPIVYIGCFAQPRLKMENGIVLVITFWKTKTLTSVAVK